MHSSRMRTARSSSCWGGLPQCMLGYTPGYTPGNPPLGVDLETPPGVGLETPQVWAWRSPPWLDPSTSPLGVGLETCKACLDTPSGDLLPGMLGYHLQCMLGYHPSCEQNHIHM